MRKFTGLLGVIVLTLFLQTGCVGHLKDIRIGKTFAIISPDKVVLLREPSLDSETFHLDKPDVFIVEDLTWPKEYTFGDKASMVFGDEGEDLTALKEGDSGKAAILADVNIAGLYKVRFDSGIEAYINSRYIYPSRSKYVVSEDVGMARGMTMRQYIEWFEKWKEKNNSIFMRLDKAESEAREEFGKKRREKILSAPWSKQEKELVSEGKLKAGMTKEEVFLSQNTFEDFLKKTAWEKGALEGPEEEWAMGNKTYRFKNDVLAEWDTKEVSCKEVLKKRHTYPGYKELHLGMTPSEINDAARCTPWKSLAKDYSGIGDNVVAELLMPENERWEKWTSLACRNFYNGEGCYPIDDIIVVYLEGRAVMISFKGRRSYAGDSLRFDFFKDWLSEAYRTLEDKYGKPMEVYTHPAYLSPFDSKEKVIASWRGGDYDYVILLSARSFGLEYRGDITFVKAENRQNADDVIKSAERLGSDALEKLIE